MTPTRSRHSPTWETLLFCICNASANSYVSQPASCAGSAAAPHVAWLLLALAPPAQKEHNGQRELSPWQEPVSLAGAVKFQGPLSRVSPVHGVSRGCGGGSISADAGRMLAFSIDMSLATSMSASSFCFAAISCSRATCTRCIWIKIKSSSGTKHICV